MGGRDQVTSLTSLKLKVFNLERTKRIKIGFSIPFPSLRDRVEVEVRDDGGLFLNSKI